jgi:hypothetical protein
MAKGYMRAFFRRNLIFVTTILFFFASLALAIHYHDIPVQTIPCSICKVKSSVSGTPYKIKTDCSLFSITSSPSLVADVYLAFSGLVPEAVVFPLPALYFLPDTNKAPPIPS